LTTARKEPSQQEQAQADNALADAVLAGTVRHGNDRALDVSVKVSRWRTSGDTRVLDRKGAKDISPLRAASLALWGASASKPLPAAPVVEESIGGVSSTDDLASVNF
jgi:hypothetical protein